MGALAAVFGWLGRKAVVYVLLVAALVAAAKTLPLIKSEWVGPDIVSARIERLTPILVRMTEARTTSRAAFSNKMREARRSSASQITAQLRIAEADRDALIAGRSKPIEKLRYLMTADAEAVLADQQRELKIRVREHEIASLQKAKSLAIATDKVAVFDEVGQAKKATALRLRCNAADVRLKAFDRQWIGRRLLDRDIGTARFDDVTTKCGEAEKAESDIKTRNMEREIAEKIRQDAADAFNTIIVDFDNQVEAVTPDLRKQIENDRTALNGSLKERLRVWAERVDLIGKAWVAMWILLLITITPLVIRTFLYYVLAPIAARRPPIRIIEMNSEKGPLISPVQRSTTSVGVRLGEGEELLIRQSYLQSSSDIGGKAIRGLLDYRRPLTSIAAGLSLLTRVRGVGQLTTVSAVRDPHAEVALLTLPAGAACVLHPRALAAVAQPIDRPLRITRHWRLFSLNAWLTLQLRYLVFHGPARLVVKGGRGVRVERATHGRIFGQDQLVGFSADLTYSVTRTETFWPYLFGRESLLKDRVVGGDGVLIVEEAPLSARGGNGARRGLEGAIDALLKPLGI